MSTSKTFHKSCNLLTSHKPADDEMDRNIKGVRTEIISECTPLWSRRESNSGPEKETPYFLHA